MSPAQTLTQVLGFLLLEPVAYSNLVNKDKICYLWGVRDAPSVAGAIPVVNTLPFLSVVLPGVAPCLPLTAAVSVPLLRGVPQPHVRSCSH